MNLLLISVKSEKPTGGIAVWTEHFLSYCENNNIHCHLINTEISSQRSSTGKRRMYDELVRTKHILSDLKKAIRTENFDAVYMNTSCGPYGLFRDTLLAKIVKKKGLPLITHYHCDIPFWVRHKPSVACLKKLAAISNQNLVLCQNSKNFLWEKYHCPSIKIPNFIDSSLICQQEKEISETIQKIVFVGQVSESKGANELFAVAQLLPNIQFSLIGKVTNEVLLWEKPTNVTLCGELSKQNVLQHLDTADLFLFPSHTEGSSIALIESLARGLPAVATDVGANADVLGGDCGIIVSKGDVDAMVSAITLLEDTNTRGEMSLKSIKRVKTYYTEKNINKIVNLLQS